MQKETKDEVKEKTKEDKKGGIKKEWWKKTTLKAKQHIRERPNVEWKKRMTGNRRWHERKR